MKRKIRRIEAKNGRVLIDDGHVLSQLSAGRGKNPPPYYKATHDIVFDVLTQKRRHLRKRYRNDRESMELLITRIDAYYYYLRFLTGFVETSLARLMSVECSAHKNR